MTQSEIDESSTCSSISIYSDPENQNDESPPPPNNYKPFFSDGLYQLPNPMKSDHQNLKSPSSNNTRTYQIISFTLEHFDLPEKSRKLPGYRLAENERYFYLVLHLVEKESFDKELWNIQKKISSECQTLFDRVKNKNKTIASKNSNSAQDSAIEMLSSKTEDKDIKHSRYKIVRYRRPEKMNEYSYVRAEETDEKSYWLIDLCQAITPYSDNNILDADIFNLPSDYYKKEKETTVGEISEYCSKSFSEFEFSSQSESPCLVQNLLLDTIFRIDHHKISSIYKFFKKIFGLSDNPFTNISNRDSKAKKCKIEVIDDSGIILDYASLGNLFLISGDDELENLSEIIEQHDFVMKESNKECLTVMNFGFSDIYSDDLKNTNGDFSDAVKENEAKSKNFFNNQLTDWVPAQISEDSKDNLTRPNLENAINYHEFIKNPGD